MDNNTNLRKIVVAGPLPPAALALFDARDDIVYESVTDVSEENLLDKMRDAAGVTVRTAKINARVIEAAEGLQIVSRYGVGYDNVDVAALTERGIPLTVVGTANSVAVAEAAIYMMMELAKMGREHDRAVRESNWDYRLELNAIEMWRKKLLIVGFGRIGTRLADRCRGFDMDIHVADPFVDDATIAEAGCIPVEDYRAALPDMDYVSLHLPLSEETENMFDRDAFTAMKPSAILVNAARGGIVNEDALHEALRTGQIRGAGLDVFDLEPPRADDALFSLDNVIFSPHIAGVTKEAALRMGMVCVQNVLDALDGKPDPDMVINGQVLDPA
jgi:D-3-phosphoglycerate dehydrogenase